MHPRKTIKSLIALGAIVLGSGCIDKITTPVCTPVTLTSTETRGDTVILNTGLRLIEGDLGGGLPAAWCAPVAVHYVEYLLDGTVLENSRDIESPLIFTPGLGDLIDGFEQGVVGMRANGKRRIIVPANLAYGDQERKRASGVVEVPRNSVLVYDIEVLTVGQAQ